jgi:hypothetical protein
MSKKVLLLIVSLLILSSCFSEPTLSSTLHSDATSSLPTFSSPNIYEGNEQNQIQFNDESNYNRASMGYLGVAEQGYSQWYYQQLVDGKISDLSLNNNIWGNTNNFIDGPYMNAKNGSVLRTYINPRTSIVTIIGNYKLKDDQQPGATIKIYHNNDLIYEDILESSDTMGRAHNLKFVFYKNSVLKFVVSGGIVY